jgi:hypothetical protein
VQRSGEQRSGEQRSGEQRSGLRLAALSLLAALSFLAALLLAHGAQVARGSDLTLTWHCGTATASDRATACGAVQINQKINKNYRLLFDISCPPFTRFQTISFF